RRLERRCDSAREEPSLSDHLMAAGAVLGEEAQPRGDAPLFGMRLRNRRARAERGDVGDELVDLYVGEARPRTLGLLVGIEERHVAGAQVEVGSKRARPFERRPEPDPAARGL